MSSAFRRLSKSSAGTLIMAFILVLILVGFAMGDIQSIVRGGGISGSADTMAKVGSDTVSDRDVTRAMERRLSQVREQKPDADYPAIAGDFEPLLNALIDAKALEEFARKNGFNLSKRLEDGQIAQLPGTKGLDGKFSEQAYRQFLSQQRMTDQDIRMVIRNGLLQQLLIAPIAVNARAPVGMATPYASILLEGREAEVAFVPTEAFRAGLNPTPADLQNYYNANRRRYMVPEQRVIRYAPILPGQVNVQPTEKEISDYYAANTATYGAKETRVISRAIVPDQAAAQAIVNRVRSGQTFAAASAPAGLTANDISVGPQTRAEFTDLAGDKVAAATFAAQEGALVGPLQSDVGWNVVKVDQIKREGGKTLATVRSEIITKLTTEKRKEAVENLVDKVQTALDDGSNFSEAAAAGKLQVSETPPVTADGRAPGNPDFKLAPELASGVLKSGFDLGEGDEPAVETLPNDAGYVMVEPARIIAAAPAPLAGIRDRVAQDWIAAEAARRAKQLADSITAKGGKAALADAAKGTPVPVRIEPVKARRIQLSRFQGKVPPALQAMFSMAQGKVRTVAGGEGEGFYVVKVDKIIPGNALAAPGLIGSTQREMQEAMSQEYGLQFVAALRKAVGVKRNEKAIAATKARIAGGGS